MFLSLSFNLIKKVIFAVDSRGKTGRGELVISASFFISHACIPRMESLESAMFFVVLVCVYL